MKNNNRKKAKIKYVIYARKNTDYEECGVLSVASQIEETRAMAKHENLAIADIRYDRYSALYPKKTLLTQTLEDIGKGTYQGILIWEISRISNDIEDIATILNLMDKKLLVEIKTSNHTFRNTPHDRLLLLIRCGLTRFDEENMNIYKLS